MSIITESKTEKKVNGDGDSKPFAALEPRRDATVMEIAAVIAASRDFPDCRTPEKATVRIMAGKEMGVGPIASVIGIRVQNGRVSMDATLMAGCIKRFGMYDYQIKFHDSKLCELEFYEIDRIDAKRTKVGESSFSWADAETAGLDRKDTWKFYPRNMLFARALSNGARWYCPAIFGGAVYTHEELGYAVDDEGRAIDSDSAGAGNELCTRDQRQEIARLIDALSDSMPNYLAVVGVKLLDELSGYEAEKEIKKLQKRFDKKSGNGKATAAVTVAPGEPVVSTAEPPLSPAKKMLADAFDESAKLSTPLQHERIFTLAEMLEPDEAACREMLKAAIVRRGRKKLAELDYLQASALIESLNAKIGQVRKEAAEKNTPPFDADPPAGKKNGN